MGLYINPENMTKEQWLKENYMEMLLAAPPRLPFDFPKTVHVCLVDNGPFTAAGVIFSQRELEAFSYPSDNRRKIWFLVPYEKIEAVCGKEACHDYFGAK